MNKKLVNAYEILYALILYYLRLNMFGQVCPFSSIIEISENSHYFGTLGNLIALPNNWQRLRFRVLKRA